MSLKPAVTRRDFIRKFMAAGFTYDQATRAFCCMIGIVEDALVGGDKIKFGKVGCLFPKRKPPRDVVMSFRRGPKGEVTPSKRIFHLDERVDYRFNFYREFMRRHQLR